MNAVAATAAIDRIVNALRVEILRRVVAIQSARTRRHNIEPRHQIGLSPYRAVGKTNLLHSVTRGAGAVKRVDQPHLVAAAKVNCDRAARIGGNLGAGCAQPRAELNDVGRAAHGGLFLDRQQAIALVEGKGISSAIAHQRQRLSFAVQNIRARITVEDRVAARRRFELRQKLDIGPDRAVGERDRLHTIADAVGAEQFARQRYAVAIPKIDQNIARNVCRQRCHGRCEPSRQLQHIA